MPIDLTSTKGGYALYPQDRPSQKVIVRDDNVSNVLSDNTRDIFLKYRVSTIHGSFESLLSRDTDKIVKKNVFKQLKRIIEEGNLNESQSDSLLLEKIANIIYFYHKDLGYDLEIDDYYYPRYSIIYPIDLEDISEKIYRFYAIHHFKEMHKKELIKTGRVPIKNKT